MIADNELAQLQVPLASLPGFDPTGLWVSHAGVTDMCANAPLPDWVADPTVTLADSATADRVARWIAERTKLQTGATAPEWKYVTSSAGWWLTFDCVGSYHPVGTSVLHSLTDSVSDDRRLPDGSRFIDRLALALVAVEVSR